MKPEPISKHIVCSVCGMSWDAHKKVQEVLGTKVEEGDMLICVGLLRKELERPRPLGYPGGRPIQAWAVSGGTQGMNG